MIFDGEKGELVKDFLGRLKTFCGNCFKKLNSNSRCSSSIIFFRHSGYLLLPM